MLEVVITFKTGGVAIWQVIDLNKNCLILKDNLKTSQDGRDWIKAQKKIN